jgi:hypothetical protein
MRERPKLSSIHGEATIRANPALTFWEKQATADIVNSLVPGSNITLIVKPDGTILDGNTRVWILRQRGYDVDTLPRTIYDPGTGECFDG